MELDQCPECGGVTCAIWCTHNDDYYNDEDYERA